MNLFHVHQNTFAGTSKVKYILVFAPLMILSLCCLATQAQAGPAPIQTYFVPLPELQVQTALEAVDTGTDEIGDVMNSLISVVSTGDGTIIYYDHWEDGYESDLANPVQASTEIWGDNDPGNGIPPGFATDELNVGDVISLESNVSLPRNPSQIRYDGRDKFGGTKALAVTRASWALNPGVTLAGAAEVYSLRDYGTRFEVPIGEDLNSNEMFEYVSLMVMAAEDDTEIQIDIDGNGTTDITRTLNQGESYQVDGGIDAGASITATRSVQAHIFTGDVGARFESRFYTLYPVENWSDSYYNPVGTASDGDETYVFVYNPNASPITVDYETRIGTGSFAVAAGGVYRYLMPSQSGAHFFTGDGSPFFAIATVGADPGANLVHDWGFSLLPESYLTPMAVVGWGPGSDDLTENGSPVWVTADAATTVYVDYDGDPATGPLIDANGDHYDLALKLSMLESERIYDNSDNDQTGMKLYTLDGTLITAAWGQDPATSQGGAPFLDLGTTVLPFPIASVEKTAALAEDENGNGLIDWGDTIEYTITVNNDGVIVLGGVVALDPLPAGVTYVAGSTTLNGAPVADEAVPPAATAYPLDEGGLAMPVIPPTDFSTITFRVSVDFGTTTVTNTVSINTDREVLTTDDTLEVNTPEVTACSLKFTDGSGISQDLYLENSDIYVTVEDNDKNTDAGSAQSFTVVVVNSDSGDFETITLTETDGDTGIFRNAAALASSATGGMSDEDGTLHAVAGDTLQVAFTDPLYGDTCSDAAGITIPTEIKPLYLSEPGQAMDRVDPVATADTTTATSAVLSFSSSGNRGLAVWSAGDPPEYSVWDGNSFGATQNAVTQSSSWRIMAGAAAPTRDEKIVLGIESGGEISGELWNGSTWSKTSLTSLAYVNDTFWWSADVAYEQQSGDAMLVWSGGNTYPNQLRYQVWNGSSWTAPASIAAYSGSEPKQMQLVSNPISDEMVLVVNDANEYDYALVWDGSSWGNQRLLATSTTDDRTEVFAAYEQQSGRAMVVYGKGISGVYYRLWNGSDWSGENSVAPPAGVDGYARWTTLGSDPNSNRIVLGVVSSGSDPWLSLWNGSTWDTSVLASALDSSPTTVAPNIAVAFESVSGQAMAVCGASDSKMVYRTWDSGTGWSTASTHPIVSDGNTNSMMLYSDPISDRLMHVVQDSGQDINYILWDGSSWGAATELETASGETKNQPFVFLFDQHVVPVGSSTTFTQSPVMCKDFSIPVGGQVAVSNYISVAPSNGSVSRSVAASSDDAEEEGPDGTSPGNMYLNSSDIELVEDFEPSTSGTQQIGLRFEDVSVPPGATITNAYITFRAVAADAPNTNNESVSLTIEGQAADNPGTFTSTVNDISNRLRTTASVGWSPVAWTSGTDYNTPDLSAIAQELVNRSGWSSGNSMVFIVTGSGSRSSESWDDPGSNPAQLTIEYTTGSLPATPDISATIRHDGTTIHTLTHPSVTDLGSNIYRLDWIDVISSAATVLAGEQVELKIATSEPGVTFEILYDSNTYPSKVLLPTTTVIVIHVDTLGVYDAPYPGGSPITDAVNGATLYLRATVSDPFGTDDITDLDLSISDPCGGGPTNFTLDDTDVVAAAGCSKTYEHVWNTGLCQGNYDIVAVANEGTEGITDTAAIRVTLSYTDTGTAGITAFTDAAGTPVDNYDADATICLQVTDMDQNANPAVAETLSAVVTSPQGDSETLTLTETGVDTGLFRACVASSSTVPGIPDDGSLYALPGDVLLAEYTDPDDGSDVSDDAALVNTPTADMTLSKLLVNPGDGTAVVGDLVRFDIVVGSPGPTNLTSFTVTDTFDSACMSYDAASITPDTIGAGTLAWDETELGILPVGSSVTLSVWFAADAACAPASNSVLASGFDEFGTPVSAGPAAAQVTITAPALSVTKTLISPNPGPAHVGDPVTFRVTLNNTGTSAIATLPLEDVFSAACYGFQSATVPPDGTGAGSLLWNDLGPLPTGASTSLDVTLNVTGECTPALNTADVSFAVDENGDSLPPAQDSVGLQTIGAEIGDRVWNDRDVDGIQDAGEGGMAGVIVFVDLNDNGSRDAGEPYDTTDATGAYDITDLAAGSHSVRVDAATLPAGAVLTTGNDPLAVVLAAGQDFNTADFGYRGNGSIGDLIWHDADGDGNQEGGEPGLADVTVFLDMNDDGVLDTGEPFVVTDGGGNYDFTNLAAGDYIVDVDDTTLPPGFILTTGFDSISLTLVDGEDFNAADFGYRSPDSEPTISSATNQNFLVGDPATAISTITVTDDPFIATITAAKDIRIRIPSGFNMTWNTSDLSAVIGGSAAGKVADIASYEDGGKTLVLDVTADFAASDEITIDGLSFATFTARSAADNLELEVENDDGLAAIDDKTITIAGPTISSADNQEFLVGDATTAISPITITEDSLAAVITAANDIRIRIPGDFYMLWDIVDLDAVITGSAASKVSTGVSYEDDGKTLLIDVLSDFAASDQITISGLSFGDFTAASFGDRLELEVFSDGSTVGSDDKWKAIGGLPSAGSMLVYGEGSVITPRYRTWDGTSFSIEASANSTDDVIKWAVLKPSPTEYEMVLATYSSADKNLYVQTWDGSAWTSNWNTHLNYDGNERMFDIAYENNSGDVIVVFGDKNDDTLRCRKRVDGTWDSSNQLVSGIALDNEANWVRAESRPGSDDILVAASTESKSLYALRWDGTINGWTDQIQTSVGIKDQTREGFDLAFESASGDAFLIWGDQNKNVKYRQFTSGWQPELNAYTILDKEVEWVAAAYDPLATSSKIAIAMIDGDNKFQFGAWDGSSWGGRPAAIDAPNRDNRFIDVAFESDTGEAVYGFTQNVAGDDKKKFAWRTWTSAAGFSPVTVEDGPSDEIKFVQLKADPSSDDIMAVYADKAKDLYYRFWNGSTWTALPAPLEIELSDEDKNEAFMFAWKENPPTSVNLLSFTAVGNNASVRVSWETAHEINNMGYYLYRAESPDGRFAKLTDKLIPGSEFSNLGQTYVYLDNDTRRGHLYYYRLVDVDTHGKRTAHGPICVDWDGDGMPDDWEIRHGFDPAVDDAMLDADADGLSNRAEYERGSDPRNPDTDGDGILDADEVFEYRGGGSTGSRTLSRGVYILETGSAGMTLELQTGDFEAEVIYAGGGEYERLRIDEYVHGYTTGVGKPQLPLKGLLVDIPQGKTARLRVEAVSGTVVNGYRVYPVPETYAAEENATPLVNEAFAIDAAAYAEDSFYPSAAAVLGQLYTHREQLKQQVIFYPLSFNPVSGQIRHYRRIRVRIDYEEATRAEAKLRSPQPWSPKADSRLLSMLNAIGRKSALLWSAPPPGRQLGTAFSLAGFLSASLWSPPAQGPAYRLMTAEAGLYRLSGADLDANNVDVTGHRVSGLRLYHLGTEMAICVHDADGDDRFDPEDYIQFYATGVAPAYAKYSRHNAFWLVTGGEEGGGRRMRTIDGTPAGGPVSESHEFKLHYEPDQGYWQEAEGADSLDRWFSTQIAMGDEIDHDNAGKPVTFELPLHAVDDTGPGTLEIWVYGAYDTGHELGVSYEGDHLGTFSWIGNAGYKARIDNVDFTDKTGDGKFTLSLTCLSGFDKLVFDWVEATYPRKFIAVSDRLTFSHPSGYRHTIDGFDSDELMVFDITRPDDVGQVQGFDIPRETAPYRLEFETAEDGRAHTYLVLAETEVNTSVAGMAVGSPSGLGDVDNGADYILITHQDIGWDAGGQPCAWMQALVRLREEQGLRVEVVDIQDIYDEFSYGMVTPQAIKDFLTYAYENWRRPAPRYVLLVGDSTYDFKDNWVLGTINHVPSYLTYTDYMGETVSDEWFVTVSGNDALPDLYIGRLPAKTAAEAEAMVDKISAYEQAPNTKGWEKDVLLIADDQEEPFELVFQTMNEDAARLLPAAMNPPYRGYLEEYLAAGFAPVDLREDIVDRINAGTLMVSFSGHGYLQGWTREGVFDSGDIDTLTNAGTYPFITSMNCLTGYFAYPEAWASSFAELLLRAENKGTAAALMPTGMTTTEGQHVLNTALFETVFTEDVRELGPAIAQAKMILLANGNSYFEQVSETFLLFGDPAMQLKVPLPRRPTGLEAAFNSQGGVELSWDAAEDCDGSEVAGYNIYRSTGALGNFTKLNEVVIVHAQYTDDGGTAAALSRSASGGGAETAYYYAVTSVDGDGDESIQSSMVSPTAAALSSPNGGSSGGGGCFVGAAAETIKGSALEDDASYGTIVAFGVLLCFLKMLSALKKVGKTFPS
jgi:uncharacterized repeat protein (TIGR01451 family)